MCGESCSVSGLVTGQVRLVAEGTRAPFPKPVGEGGSGLRDGSGKVGLGQPGSLPKCSGKQTGNKLWEGTEFP